VLMSDTPAPALPRWNADVVATLGFALW